MKHIITMLLFVSACSAQESDHISSSQKIRSLSAGQITPTHSLVFTDGKLNSTKEMFRVSFRNDTMIVVTTAPMDECAQRFIEYVNEMMNRKCVITWEQYDKMKMDVEVWNEVRRMARDIP